MCVGLCGSGKIANIFQGYMKERSSLKGFEITWKENMFKTMQIKIWSVFYSPFLPKHVYGFYLPSKPGGN